MVNQRIITMVLESENEHFHAETNNSSYIKRDIIFLSLVICKYISNLFQKVFRTFAFAFTLANSGRWRNDRFNRG